MTNTDSCWVEPLNCMTVSECLPISLTYVLCCGQVMSARLSTALWNWQRRNIKHLCMLSKVTTGTRCTLMIYPSGVCSAFRSFLDISLSNNLYQDYGLWHTQVLSVLMKLNDFLIPAVNAPAVVLDSGKCFRVHQLSLFVVLLFACAQVTGDGLEKSNRA